MKLHKEGKSILRNQLIIYLLIGFITQCNYNFFYYVTPAFLAIFLLVLWLILLSATTEYLHQQIGKLSGDLEQMEN